MTWIQIGQADEVLLVSPFIRLRFIRLRFIGLRFIGLRFIGLRFIGLAPYADMCRAFSAICLCPSR